MCCRCARHLKVLNDKALSQAQRSVVGSLSLDQGSGSISKTTPPNASVVPSPSVVRRFGKFFLAAGCGLFAFPPVFCSLYSGCMRYITDQKGNGNKNHSHCSYNITLKEVGKLPGMPKVPKNRMQNTGVRTQNSRKKQGWNAEAGSEESSDSRKRSTAQRTRKN